MPVSAERWYRLNSFLCLSDLLASFLEGVDHHYSLSRRYWSLPRPEREERPECLPYH